MRIDKQVQVQIDCFRNEIFTMRVASMHHETSTNACCVNVRNMIHVTARSTKLAEMIDSNSILHRCCVNMMFRDTFITLLKSRSGAEKVEVVETSETMNNGTYSGVMGTGRERYRESQLQLNNT